MTYPISCQTGSLSGPNIYTHNHVNQACHARNHRSLLKKFLIKCLIQNQILINLKRDFIYENDMNVFERTDWIQCFFKNLFTPHFDLKNLKWFTEVPACHSVKGKTSLLVFSLILTKI